MRKFIYITLICGILSGAGVFMNFPQYPNLLIPAGFSILGILCVCVTIPDKQTSNMLKFGGFLINFMPLMAIIFMPE